MPKAALPPESEFLTPDDVRFMTDRAQVRKQCERLTELGVPFHLVGRHLLVSRFHVREWLAGRSVTPSRGVDFSTVR